MSRFVVALIEPEDGSVEHSYFDENCFHVTRDKAHVWTWQTFLNDLRQCMPQEENPIIDLRFEYVDD